MMRTGALALLMLMAACGGPETANESAARGNDGVAEPEAGLPEAAATVTIAATGPGGCSSHWDGQPVTPAQVLQRSVTLVERALATAGGVQNLTEETIPVIGVEAPATLGFACADTILSPIRRAGVPRVLLTPTGGQNLPTAANFSLSDIAVPPPSAVVAAGAGGRLTWNGESIDLNALTDRARQMGGGLDRPLPPGALELRPARDANFGQVHAALRAIRQGNVRAALLLPSVTPNPRPPLPAPRPGPPPEAELQSNLSAPPR